MKSFGARVGKSKKVDNHDASLPDKIEIRQRVLDAVGGRVFDAYAGTGVMWKAVWSKAQGYEGCDERYLPDERTCFVGDSRRVLRNIDLAPFQIFDLDSYGSPWEAAIIIAARRKVVAGERIGIVLTEGSGLKLKFGALPGALAILSGSTATPRPAPGGTHKVDIYQPGASRAGELLCGRAILAMARRMNCSIEKIWRASRPSHTAMFYFGVVMTGLEEQP